MICLARKQSGSVNVNDFVFFPHSMYHLVCGVVLDMVTQCAHPDPVILPSGASHKTWCQRQRRRRPVFFVITRYKPTAKSNYIICKFTYHLLVYNL